MKATPAKVYSRIYMRMIVHLEEGKRIVPMLCVQTISRPDIDILTSSKLVECSGHTEYIFKPLIISQIHRLHPDHLI
jgi:hypothetical protein